MICVKLAAALALPALVAAAAGAAAATPAPGPFAGRVDLGDGWKLYAECRGRGAPLVVLEWIGFAPSFAQMRRAAAARPARRIPAVVISRRLPLAIPAGTPGGLTTGLLKRTWRVGQARLAAAIPAPGGSSCAGGSHYVMFTELVTAVRDVLDEVRATGR